MISDFNIEPNEAIMQMFINLYSLKKSGKEKTWVRNTDWFLSKLDFLDYNTYETGLLNFHQMTVSVLKIYFPKSNKFFQNVIVKVYLERYSTPRCNAKNVEDHQLWNMLIEILEKYAQMKNISEQIRVVSWTKNTEKWS